MVYYSGLSVSPSLLLTKFDGDVGKSSQYKNQIFVFLTTYPSNFVSSKEGDTDMMALRILEHFQDL
ncbi:hypothetical protein NX82_04305 [Proteus mirabilis]|nr:hypothetical protein NX82_04305 [Proteus mirabilis]